MNKNKIIESKNVIKIVELYIKNYKDFKLINKKYYKFPKYIFYQ